MKIVRFIYQFLIIVLAFAVIVFAASDSVSLNKLSPSANEDYNYKIDPIVLNDASYSNNERIKVIVSLLDNQGNVPKTTQTMNNVLSSFELEANERFGYDSFVVELTKEEIELLARNRNVERISADAKIFKVSLNDVVDIVDANPETWTMSYKGSNIDGAGQTIAIIDTGIDFTHPDLSSKNVVGNNLNCFTTNTPCFVDGSETDLNGHGTHVAGIAAAASGSGIPGGIAKGANLVALKVFPGNSGQGVGQTEIRRALDWAVANKDVYDISVISMSIGDGVAHEEYCDSWLATIRNGVNNAVANGISVIIASGNDGSFTGINAPACLSNAIPVAATEKDDELWIGSNHNWMVKLMAPGAGWNLGDQDYGVLSTCSTSEGNGNYCRKTGTSMATPAVAGAFAMAYQVIDLHGVRQNVNPKTKLEPLFFRHGQPIDGVSQSQSTRLDTDDTISEMVNYYECLRTGFMKACRSYDGYNVGLPD